MYINCHTYFSLRYGTISEEELLQIALKDGATTVALTDINNTSACLNFIRQAQKVGIRPVVGIDFRDGARQLYLCLAMSNEGFQEINTFLSKHNHNKEPLPVVCPQFEHVVTIYPFSNLKEIAISQLTQNEYIGISHKELNKLTFATGQQGLLQKDKLLALETFSWRHKRDYNTHRLLRSIDNNVLLSKLSLEDQGQETDTYRTLVQIEKLYDGHSYLIENSKAILESCEIHFDFSASKPHQNKLNYLADPEEDLILLQTLCHEGLRYRYSEITPEIEERLQKELDMIQKMDFVPFFLINWDIIEYAKQQGYYHVGRGSGANSIVAYLLGITDVDPIDLDLYFERFMNLYRSSPPDFDIDFSWRDREDVTRYIFERFGAEHQTALLATYNTFQHSAAVRELGKVFGLPKEEIDKLSSGNYTHSQLDKLEKLVLTYAKELEGRPNYLSIHAGGVLISERPMHYFSATDLPPKGFATTQFDMHVAEDVGLNKYDILGQRGLGKIKDALAIIRENHPDAPDIDIHNVQPFLTDPNVNQMISEARCIGCFYVESPAMRMLLSKLSVNNYHLLVAASSIIRPGVAQSGMMREYILRHKYPERRKQAHPVLYDIMPDTYGVMVYQEDVIKVAHHFAGLDLGEADVLRRGMSGKYRSREEFLKVQDQYFINCRERGYSDEVAQEIWRQIESFAGYAFAKGHSASYAVESYQSLYLKCYYPLEYMVAVLNNGGGFYRPETYIHEARQLGGIIHAPCVNHGSYEYTIQGKDIYLGFCLLSNLDSKVALRIESERKKNGLYQSLEDFLERVPMGIEQADVLIRINALRYTGLDKRTLLWRAHHILQHTDKSKVGQSSLFGTPSLNHELPHFQIDTLENAFDEIEIMGFPLCSPFDLLADTMPERPILATHFRQLEGKVIQMVGYLVTIKNTKTAKGKRMNFGTFLDIEGNWIDTVHFPPVAARYPFRGRGIYQLTGKVVNEFDFYSLEIQSMQRLPYVEDVRFKS